MIPENEDGLHRLSPVIGYIETHTVVRAGEPYQIEVTLQRSKTETLTRAESPRINAHVGESFGESLTRSLIAGLAGLFISDARLLKGSQLRESSSLARRQCVTESW